MRPAGQTQPTRRVHLVQRVGGALALLGGLTAFVFVWQPWVSRDYEDSSAGCRPGTAEQTGLVTSLRLLLAGLAVAIVATVVAARAQHASPRPRR
ncbi:hypothetical protein [Kineococcus esterisolvens]|uniref:hypothetical protein n=1 Tax=unclassified Kineococcus TaxID=2621656 RepID=UPI003D7EFCBC